MGASRVGSVIDRFDCDRCKTLYERVVESKVLADPAAGGLLGNLPPAHLPKDWADGLGVHWCDAPEPDPRVFKAWLCPRCREEFESFMRNHVARDTARLPVQSIRPKPVPAESSVAEQVSDPK